MVITTTRVMQMHDIVKTLQDRPESVKEILWSKGPWLGKKSSRKHGKITMKYGITRPLQHLGTISLEAKTSVC